ncbi:MAG: hypothetical protein IK045_04150 [Bacteroidales bacterium]|nr:hypothetical protein [Bacteroidales bacterium]
MGSISIPLRIEKGRLLRVESEKESVDRSLALLMSTPCRSTVSDPDYGFVFNNMRFEIFNENEGVVYDSAPGRDGFEALSGLYDKKISGTSNNLKTFSADLKAAIESYEKRLKRVSVGMNYVRQERKIHISVKGKLASTGESYQYLSVINVWK